jgi:malate dehydrogenase (oxaloacetate-decarboxylating)
VRKGQIIFALSNPDPEILPEVALAAGAAFAGDGRSVNNALAFPGIIRAVLATKVRHVTPDMLVAAAEAIAACAMAGELVPSPLDPRVHDMVSSAVAVKVGAAGRSGTIRLAQSS